MSRETCSKPPIFTMEYQDHQREMRRLAESIEGVYEQILKIVADSPAEVVLRVPTTTTPSPIRPILPRRSSPTSKKCPESWRKKGSCSSAIATAKTAGSPDLIRDSGIHIAEAVCPFPMTKV